MSIDMSQFFQVFFEESAEHLAAMESLLLDLDLDRPDIEQLNAIFRAAHSIKGSAGTFGFTDLAETTHILENLLDRIRKNELQLRADMVDAFLEAGDVLRSMLEAHQGHAAVDPQTVEAMTSRLRQLSSDDSGGAVISLVAAQASAADPLDGESSVLSESLDVLPSTPVPRVFDIQFVPTDVAASGVGVQNLLTELRSFGELEILDSPASKASGAGYWNIRLRTSQTPEVFSDQIDFIAESGAWRISEETSTIDDGSEAFGFFQDSPGVPDEFQGYGFFEPLPLVDSENLVAEEGDGFGFFAPLPTPASGDDGGDSDDYGFFEPISPPSSSPELVAPLVSAAPEEDDGFGFFQPIALPPSVVIDPQPVPSPVVDKLVPAAKPVASATKSPSVSAATSDSSIRVSVEKVDQLINLVGELVITQAMLLQTSALMQEQAPERLLNGLAQLERNTRDLQESVMAIRMMPISFVFSRFPRVVRDLSSKLGKQVELKTSGETTELDKNLIERIADPLTHLIRNSLDHGIELPEKRQAAGKRPSGTITLKAYHQGGNIVIEVGDDGAGLPRDKILQKARERGLAVSDQMSDPEVFNLIFEAGFSTAEQVTDVSGRGVGMDVVRRNIQSMGGRVEIDSMLGIGTRMTVRLPLTLAILDGMSVAVGDQIYILPLSYVIESLQPKAGDVKTLSNQARVVQVRGEYLPVVVLHEMFRLQSAWTDFTQGIMVVLDADGAKVALFVDALLGQHQVVIKSLEANYRKVPGVSGATIMGDGHVALILDVSAIAGMARTNMQKAG
jgi:two-component system, chemotaxis family, sensor kinase CheA